MVEHDPVDLAGRLLAKYAFEHPPVNAGIVLSDFPVAVVLQPWSPDVSGVFVRGQTLSHIGLNGNHSIERRHFTLWHEFYHFIAHKGIRYVEYTRQVANRLERDADTFAAHVLMPEPWVRNLWGKHAGHVSLMARDCLVSRQAMAWRLRELGLS